MDLKKEADLIKVESPLSSTTDVLIFFDGAKPDAACFTRLRELLAVVEAAYTGSSVKATEAPDVQATPTLPKPGEKPRKKYGPRKFKELTCDTHPGTPRHPKTNRCIACQDAHMASLRGRKVDDLEDEDEVTIEQLEAEDDAEGSYEGPLEGDEEEPVIADKPEFVWSHPVRCSKCGAGMVRLFRKKDADLIKDYWIHTKSPTEACTLKIVHYKDIKVDADYTARKNAEQAA